MKCIILIFVIHSYQNFSKNFLDPTKSREAAVHHEKTSSVSRSPGTSQKQITGKTRATTTVTVSDRREKEPQPNKHTQRITLTSLYDEGRGREGEKESGTSTSLHVSKLKVPFCLTICLSASLPPKWCGPSSHGHWVQGDCRTQLVVAAVVR